MEISEVHLFPNTAPSGPGGFVANVTVRVKLAEETYEEALAALEDALSPFTTGSEAKPAAKAEPEPEKEEKPKRRRRAAKAEPEPEPEKEEEAEPPKPRRRRRKAAEADDEPKGPTAEDVAKVASEGASVLGPKTLADIIGDFSDSGNVADIPADKRQEFIDEVNYNMEDDD